LAKKTFGKTMGGSKHVNFSDRGFSWYWNLSYKNTSSRKGELLQRMIQQLQLMESFVSNPKVPMQTFCMTITNKKFSRFQTSIVSIDAEMTTLRQLSSGKSHMNWRFMRSDLF